MFAVYILFSFLVFYFFYGPVESFREFWITSAMTTMSHQYLATWIYSDDYIQKVLAKNKVVEVDEVSDPNKIKFRHYSTTIYGNPYEKEILS